VTTRPPRPPRTVAGPRQRAVRGALLAAVPLTLATALGLLLVTGALAPQLLADAGPVVRWGAPAVRGLMDLALALTLGLLIMLTFVVPRTSPAWQRASVITAVAASTWAVSAIGWLVLAGAESIGLSPADPAFGGQLAFFLTEVEFGQLLTAAAVLAMVAATLPAVGLRTPTGSAWALVLTVVAVVPVALTGHSAGTEGHRTAVSSWWLHVLGVGGWVGGIAALALLGGLLGKDLPVVARRYSALAGWAFVLVVISGVANAFVRLPLSELGSTYGLLVLGKTAAALLLGVAGWWHRRSTLARLDAAVRGLRRAPVLAARRR
jgi:putative copper export protein